MASSEGKESPANRTRPAALGVNSEKLTNETKDHVEELGRKAGEAIGRAKGDEGSGGGGPMLLPTEAASERWPSSRSWKLTLSVCFCHFETPTTEDGEGPAECATWPGAGCWPLDCQWPTASEQ